MEAPRRKWIRWQATLQNEGRCPCDPDALIYVRLKADRHNEWLHTPPQKAGRYLWTRDCGIVAYALAGKEAA